MAGKGTNIGIAVVAVGSLVGLLLLATRVKAAPDETPELTVNIHGVIYDASTGEVITGRAKVAVYGYQPWGTPYYLMDSYFNEEYAYSLPAGRYAIWCFVDEYEPQWIYDVQLDDDLELDIGMQPSQE